MKEFDKELFLSICEKYGVTKEDLFSKEEDDKGDLFLMKVIIDIPKEFESDAKDNFQDFFERVKVEIEHRINTDDTLLCGNYERETAKMFLNTFKDMQIIPDNATNGDVIKAVTGEDFSRGASIYNHDLMICEGEYYLAFNIDWWNSTYKKEVEK